MKRTLSILLLSLLPMFGAAKPLEPGAPAPTLTVITDSAEQLALADVYAKGPVLLFFYPKSFTPGCTKQACNLADNFEAVQAAGITVLGVSRDKVDTQADFREKYKLPYTLIADADGALGKAFGVGSSFKLFHKRQSFLVVDGKVAWRDLSASPGTQSEDALAAFAAVQ
jgi:peroxiredoxin Q/BCP